MTSYSPLREFIFCLCQMVPDSEEMLKSPVIPAPPLVRIPSRSPHKSALASPGRKKSPSPKRVQFVSQVPYASYALINAQYT